jgi:Bacterial regulatory helix-turn-helix proteins, AraC family.
LELNDKVLDLRVIAIEAGFTSVESFVKVFKEYEGMSPLKYRELKDSLTRK